MRLVTFDTANFSFKAIVGNSETEEMIVDFLCKEIKKHKKGFPGADIKLLQSDIKAGGYSIYDMQAGHLYRDGQKL
jgi:hypothetical protein